MAFSLTSDMNAHKDMPAYKPLLKTILKSQIQLLVNQLSEYGDEECVLLTASLADSSSSHIGSKYGHSFLTRYRYIKSNFLTFCLEKKNDVKHFQQTASQSSAPTGQRKVDKRGNIMQMPKSKCCRPQPETVKVSNNELTANNSVDAIHRQSENVSTTSTSDQSEKNDENIEDQREINGREDISIGNQTVANKGADRQETNDNKGCSNNHNRIDHTESHPNSESDMKIDSIIIKIEPAWMEQCEDDTINREDNSNMEESTDMEENKYDIEFIADITDFREKTVADKCDMEVSSESNSNSIDTSSSSQGHNSGINEEYLKPEFLCCNDNLIWEKNFLPKPKRTVKAASLWKKYSIIKEVEQKKKTKAAIAKEYGVPSSTLSTWLKYADQIKADIEDQKIDPNKKKRRYSRFYDIETALLEWLKIVHMQAVIPKITSVNICDKANQLAKQFGYTSETFQCTSGWVERFKIRHGFNKNFVKGDNCN